MTLRSLLVDNLSWKLLSLALAILIWSGARMFMGDEVRPLVRPLQPLAARDFTNVPVRVLTPPRDPVVWDVQPASVHVRAAAEIGIVERITQADPIVYIQPATERPDTPTTNRVEVRLPPGVRLISVIPERVIVSALAPTNITRTAEN